jgi:hypothetical protein
MYSPSPDSSDITFQLSGSRLLSESPILLSSSESDTGPGGDDLSISELSLFDRTVTFQKPFSLLASSQPEGPSTPTRGDEDADAEEEEPNNNAEKAELEKRHAAKLHEEKLQSDIFILKKLNASFALFNEALQEAGSANQVRPSIYSFTYNRSYFLADRSTTPTNGRVAE